MKVKTADASFQPITITLETPEEVAVLETLLVENGASSIASRAQERYSDRNMTAAAKTVVDDLWENHLVPAAKSIAGFRG